VDIRLGCFRQKLYHLTENNGNVTLKSHRNGWSFGRCSLPSQHTKSLSIAVNAGWLFGLVKLVIGIRRDFFLLPFFYHRSYNQNMPVNILIVLLVIALILSTPIFPYAATWGYAPFGGLGGLLLLLLLLKIFGII